MYNQINFIEEALSILHAKGWTSSYANVEVKIFAAGRNEFKSAYIYPVAPLPGDDDIAADSIYMPNYRLETPDDREEKLKEITGCPTVKEYRLKTLLEAIAKVEVLAAGLDVPHEFINPLTAMADQLRSNAITAA